MSKNLKQTEADIRQKSEKKGERFMKNKIMWKDVTLIVLAILLIFSMCRIHTLKQSNKKLYSQNLELNHQLATLKEKNTGLESKLNSEESITDEKKSDNSQH